jgi:5'-nucleotidase / UDP-sugar diphosphatase
MKALIQSQVLLFLFTLIMTHPLEASAQNNHRLLRIIHTNDLHSHLDHATNPDLGGYARVKGKIDQLRAESMRQGIETVVLDGGDFMEGSQYYLAGQGTEVLRAMDSMGYDAVTIGNHDWLMGIPHLDWMLGQVRPKFAFLGANFYHTRSEKNLTRYMKPYVELQKGGLNIAVLGLTSHEVFYSWRMEDGFISHPVREARRYLPEIRTQNDLVIALTHIGIKHDMSLGRSTEGIDIIVGGHSHSELHDPIFVQDRRGRSIPIVQTGKHGENVGDLLVYVDPIEGVKVLSYRLHAVNKETPVDPKVQKVITQAREQLYDDYGQEWLDGVVGRTEVPLVAAEHGPTIWGQFLTDTLVDYSGGADASLDVFPFTGLTQPQAPSHESNFTFFILGCLILRIATVGVSGPPE